MDCNGFKEELETKKADNMSTEATDHGKECSECDAKSARLKSDMELLKKALTFDNSGIDVTESVMIKIRNRKPKRAYGMNKVARMSILMATAACVALFLVFNAINTKSPETDSSSIAIIAMNNNTDNEMIEEMLSELYMPSDEESCIEYYEIYE